MCAQTRNGMLQRRLSLIHNAPEKSANMAALRYVHDDQPGLSRKKRGRGFAYFDPDGKLITDKKILARIQSLGIPPAYTDVWICPDPNGHLQATGRADNGKKQYLYHQRWREIRNLTKFSHMISFGELLPVIRRRVTEDLQLPGLPRRKVVAAVVYLLESTLIRVGNDEYARKNHSYGLATLTKDHVDVVGSQVRFEFKGKGGKEWSLGLRDPRIAKIIKKCASLPGYELFQYYDAEGNWHDVDSGDVNDYLREVTGQEMTAKDFRTWAGTVGAFQLLLACDPADECSKTQAKSNITQTIKQVAQELGNTAAVCRKSYIHPHVLDCYLDGTLRRYQPDDTVVEGLQPEEVATLTLLKASLKSASDILT